MNLTQRSSNLSPTSDFNQNRALIFPDFHLAMGGDKAKDFYEEFLAQLRETVTRCLSLEVFEMTYDIL